MYSAFMGGSQTIGRAWALGLILACFALGLRLVVPAGFMAGVDADGRPTLVICTAGPGQPAGGHDDHGAPDPDDTAACAFAGAVAGPAPDASSLLTATLAAYVPVAQPLARDLAPGRGLAAPPPPLRGPPLQHA